MAQKILVLNAVFERIEELIMIKCNEILDRQEKRFGDGEAAIKFGFSNYSYAENTIKGLMISDEKVKGFIVDYYKNNFPKKYENFKSKDASDLAFDVINGKYLYDRCNEIGKLQTMKLTGMYRQLYFKFLSDKYDDIHDFLSAEEEKKVLSNKIIKAQKNLLKPTRLGKFLSNLTAVFAGYYYSYKDHTVKKFFLEIDYVRGRAEQLGFHYRQTHTSLSNEKIEEVDIGDSTLHKGEIVKADQGLAITMKGENSSYMSILLYTPGTNIQDMEFVRGQLTTTSAHGYIFSGEVFFMREFEKIPRRRLLAPFYDYEADRSEKVESIKRYLFLQRRTSYIPPYLIQEIDDLRAKKKPLNLLEPVVGTWKIWGLDKSNRIIQTKLVIDQNFHGILHVYSDVKSARGKNEEKQVCIFRITDSKDDHNLWISAHKADGTQLRNVALVELPLINKNLLNGVSCNVEVRGKSYGFSKLVFIRMPDEEKFEPCIMGFSHFFDVLFEHETLTQIHTTAFKILESVVYPENKLEENLKIPTYAKLAGSHHDFSRNSGGE